MSDLSTLSSGTSVHPGDQCLTTLWLLGARASRDTGPRRSWDPTYVAPILQVVNDAQGLVGTVPMNVSSLLIFVFVFILTLNH